ncbi:MAG: hypothetical protein O7A98_00050 [Acidobacteria bacterium]|nr:hypothetical protein [Acidobacteriota bacterium]
MSDDDQQRSGLLTELEQKIGDRHSVFVVEIAGRLVSTAVVTAAPRTSARCGRQK